MSFALRSDIMALNKGTERTTGKEMDRKFEGQKRHEEKNGQPVNDERQENDNEKGHGTNKRADGERKQSGINNGEERTGGGEKYGKELTVEVEVEGTDGVSMMEVLKEVKRKCGDVMGCRVRGERIYEITMKDEQGKTKLMDGVRVKGALVLARDIISKDMVVSFINLPVYLDDEDILSRLEEWGVRPMSAIKRRKWPGTEIADGTRFLKVRFNKEVCSLPYSTKFVTLRGAEYFRVIHDRQVRVCRLCIKPGHIFRECPEFKCFRCLKTGHYARECVERRGTEREEEEESGRGDGGEERGAEGTENKEQESGSEMEQEEEDGEVERELNRRYGTEESEGGGEEEDDEEETEQVGRVKEVKEAEDKGREEEHVEYRGEEQRQRIRGERREEGRSEKETMTAQRLTAKRKAEGSKVRGERIKGPRSGM